MLVLSFDLGGTKLAYTVMDENGTQFHNGKILLEGRQGTQVGRLITELIDSLLTELSQTNKKIDAIGVSVAGIVWHVKKTVWAPKIKGWEDYPLQKEIESVAGDIPVILESDRTCYILGEKWKGSAQNCHNAIFLAVGTGIGAGIMVNGDVLKGAQDIGGAVGWMVLHKPDQIARDSSTCYFEDFASGTGLKALANLLIANSPEYKGVLKDKKESLRTIEIFENFDSDEIAQKTLQICIELWGMGIANLVSIFNPEKIILGGGVFGPATQFLYDIEAAVSKWAQPYSNKNYSLEVSTLGKDAGVYGAAYSAIQYLNSKRNVQQNH